MCVLTMQNGDLNRWEHWEEFQWQDVNGGSFCLGLERISVFTFSRQSRLANRPFQSVLRKSRFSGSAQLELKIEAANA